MYKGDADGKGIRPAIIASRYNEPIVENLVEGAARCFTEHGVDSKMIDVFWVPGAFEIPLAAKKLAETKKYDCIVCVGCVLKGETHHFEYVAQSASSGIASVSLEADIPVMFSVILADDPRKAWSRAQGDANRGYEGALSALETVNVLRKIGGEKRKPAGRKRRQKN